MELSFNLFEARMACNHIIGEVDCILTQETA